MRRQRIDIVIPVRNYIENDENGKPKDYGISRVPDYHKKEFNSLTFLMGPANKDFDLSKHSISAYYSPMLLSVRIEIDEMSNALDIIQKPVEIILNSLSFSFQELFQPVSMVMKDVSFNLTEGENITFQQMVEPSSAILRQNYINIQAFKGIEFLAPDFSELKDLDDRNLQIALWWFNKGLNAHFLIDSISFFFIAMDNLSKPYITTPYRTRCEHEILECPICSSKIEKVHFASTLKQYLSSHGYTNREIKDLLEIRNFLHGKNVFDFKTMFKNSRLIDRLKTILHKDIMQRTKMKSNPIKLSNFTIAPFPYLSETSKISSFDIEIEKLFDTL